MLHRLLSLISKPLSRNKLSILNFHQVLKEFDPLRPWEPDAEKFEWQMGLLRRCFVPLPIVEALDLLESECLPLNAVCVTLDDGYLNNLEVALPIFEKHSIPATVFVATAFSTGSNMWNDRIIDLLGQVKGNRIDLSPAGLGSVSIDNIAARRTLANKTINQLKYLPADLRLDKVNQLYLLNGSIIETRRMMNPSEISELSRAGIEIGAHTHNHPILEGMAVQDQIDDISKNKALLEEWTGKPVTGFAFPNGRWGKDMNEENLSVIKQLHFKYAVSTDRGYTHTGSNPYTLRRFTPWDQSPLKFHARMLLNLKTNPVLAS